MTTFLSVTETAYTFEENGKRFRYSRVSTVLDRFFPVPWTEESRDRGRRIHKATVFMDTTGLETVDPVDVPYTYAYQRFKDETRVKILALELFVWSHIHGYAGTLDRIYEFPFVRNRNGLCLADIKSGIEHPRHQLQTAAYKIAHAEHNKRFTRCPRACLYLFKNGKYELRWHRDELDESAFVGYNSAFRWEQRYLTEKERNRR